MPPSTLRADEFHGLVVVRRLPLLLVSIAFNVGILVSVMVTFRRSQAVVRRRVERTGRSVPGVFIAAQLVWCFILATGAQRPTVCAYGINNGPGTNPRLGCKTV